MIQWGDGHAKNNTFGTIRRTIIHIFSNITRDLEDQVFQKVRLLHTHEITPTDHEGIVNLDDQTRYATSKMSAR